MKHDAHVSSIPALKSNDGGVGFGCTGLRPTFSLSHLRGKVQASHVRAFTTHTQFALNATSSQTSVVCPSVE